MRDNAQRVLLGRCAQRPPGCGRRTVAAGAAARQKCSPLARGGRPARRQGAAAEALLMLSDVFLGARTGSRGGDCRGHPEPLARNSAPPRPTYIADFSPHADGAHRTSPGASRGEGAGARLAAAQHLGLHLGQRCSWGINTQLEGTSRRCTTIGRHLCKLSAGKAQSAKHFSGQGQQRHPPAACWAHSRLPYIRAHCHQPATLLAPQRPTLHQVWREPLAGGSSVLCTLPRHMRRPLPLVQ